MGEIITAKELQCQQIFITTEETPSDDEDHVIQLKVASRLKKASK